MDEPYEFQDPAAAEAEGRLRGIHAVDWRYPATRHDGSIDAVVTLCGWRTTMALCGWTQVSNAAVAGGLVQGKNVTCQRCIDEWRARRG